MSAATITLGGRDFAVEPLKLGQLRALLDALDDLTGKTGGAVIDAAARVIQTGLAHTLPELTVEAVLDLEATMDEVTASVATILHVAGMTRLGETGPVASQAANRSASLGAVAESAPGSSSPGSTAPSPPAAATPIP